MAGQAPGNLGCMMADTYDQAAGQDAYPTFAAGGLYSSNKAYAGTSSAGTALHKHRGHTRVW